MRLKLKETYPLRQTDLTEKLSKIGKDITFIGEFADGGNVIVDLDLHKVSVRHPNQTLTIRLVK